MTDKYILDGHTPVPCYDLKEWGLWMNDRDKRRVAYYEHEKFQVSTVFLGLDHAIYNEKPILFETLVFNGPLDGEMRRCCTWEEAENIHEITVKDCLEAIDVGEKENWKPPDDCTRTE